MYHFMESENALSTVILDEHIELTGNTVRYLKEFQISAVRFLYNQFSKQEFCILNDESGLGKTATAAVLLGSVAMNKNCLIVVANNDDRITDWRFHLDILTDLNVNVLDEENEEYDQSKPKVFITKWHSLNALGNCSKIKFDIIVLDNRDEMLNNAFCVSTLLKCFEKQVQLVISSVDLTSNIKLLHNVLRLGGHLEPQFENFKIFEEKFNLPDIKAITSKKSNLEEYYIKRQILTDYCRSFRLRRYRHQYENLLPLVDPELYKIHLKQWTEMIDLREKTVSVIPAGVSSEMVTEKLLQKVVNDEQQQQSNHNNREQLDAEVQEITENILTNGEEYSKNTTLDDIHDDEIYMSPLIYLSDDSDGESEVIMISSNSIETVIPIVEIQDDEKNSSDIEECRTAEVQMTSSSDNLKKIRKNKRGVDSNVEKRSNKKDSHGKREEEINGKEKEKDTEIISTKKTRLDKAIEEEEEENQINDKRKIMKRPSSLQKDILGGKNSKQLTDDAANQLALRKRLSDLSKDFVIKLEKLAPKKGINLKYSFENTEKKDVDEDVPTKPTKNRKSVTAESGSTEVMATLQRRSSEENLKSSINLKKSPTSIGTPSIEPNNEAVSGTGIPPLHMENSYIENQDSDNNSSNAVNSEKTKDNGSRPPSGTRNKKKKRSQCVPKKCMMGIPLRETRNMQRTTRSTRRNHKHFKLDFEEDKKVRPPKRTPKKCSTNAKIHEETTGAEPKNGKRSKNAEEEEEKAASKLETNSKKKSAPAAVSIKTNPQILPPSSTQTSSIITPSPPLDDYPDEIQCGQRLVFSSSSDNTTPRLNEPPPPPPPKEFAMPSTPPSMRMLHNCSLFNHHHQPSSLNKSATFSAADSGDSDFLILPNIIDKDMDNVIVLSSSHDEASLSSSEASSSVQQQQLKYHHQVKKRKRKRNSNIHRRSIKELSYSRHHHSMVVKDSDSGGLAKSPDLFSLGGSDGIASNNAIPFTQIHCAPDSANTAFGFKIFGSEVRRFSDIQHPTPSTNISQPKSRSARSCLNILDEMSTAPPQEKRTEKNDNITTMTGAGGGVKKGKRSMDNKDKEMPATSKSMPMKPKRSNDLTTSDDIFEITNNTTFGSTMRINASGKVSPVQQQQQLSGANTQNHNKITNYLIGNGNTTTKPNDEELQTMQATPCKLRLTLTQNQQAAAATCSSNGNGSGNAMASNTKQKSPKSSKQLTQATKLTKWFRRSSIEDSSIKESNDSNQLDCKQTQIKTRKRRRLDLSLKS